MERQSDDNKANNCIWSDTGRWQHEDAVTRGDWYTVTLSDRFVVHPCAIARLIHKLQLQAETTLLVRLQGGDATDTKSEMVCRDARILDNHGVALTRTLR